MRVTFGNYQAVLNNGATISYGRQLSQVEADSTWNGGFKVDGRSIINILESHTDVYLISAAG